MDPEVRVKQWRGDIWLLHDVGWYIGDPSNAYVKPNGCNVMGRGISLQARTRFPGVDAWYGKQLLEQVRPTLAAGRRVRLSDLDLGALVVVNDEHRLVFLPVKTNWQEQAVRSLIEYSLAGLHVTLVERPELRVALPRLGCGNGGLDWEGDDGVRMLVRAFLAKLPAEARSRVMIVSP